MGKNRRREKAYAGTEIDSIEGSTDERPRRVLKLHIGITFCNVTNVDAISSTMFHVERSTVSL